MAEVIKSYQEILSVQHCGIKCGFNISKENFPLHRHDYYEFEIIRRGSVIHEMNGVRHTLGVGDVVALSPKDLHRFTVLEPVEICNLCIYHKNVSGTVDRLLSSARFPLLGTLSMEQLEKICAHIVCINQVLEENSAFRREIVMAHTVLFLTEIFSACASRPAPPTAQGYAHIAKAMEFISQNCTQHITLTDVAQSVHLTPSYFSKLFAEVGGQSFVKYLTEQRIEHAKMLLATTDASITTIAFAAGFGSFSAFSRAFHAYCDMAPYAFRQHAKEG